MHQRALMEYVGEDHAVFPDTMQRLKTKVLASHILHTYTDIPQGSVGDLNRLQYNILFTY